ncbi:MAG: hypothetical protein V4792_06550 [Pseudomonadota bacterium]
MTALRSITLGQLRGSLLDLLALPDDTLVSFGSGDLTFVRIKSCDPTPDGSAMQQFEFNELYCVTVAGVD